MIKIIRLTLLYALVTFCLPVFSQTKIERSKKELTADKAVKPSAQQSNSKNRASEKSELENLAWKIVVSPFKYGFIGDYRNENHLHSSLTRYPFYNSESGNFENADTLFMNEKKRFRIDIEEHFMYSSENLFGNHLKVKIRPFQYCYLQADFRQLYESVPDKDAYDRLSLFHFTFCYDRIRMEKFNFGWTAGVSYIGNEVRNSGLTFGVNADFFPTSHISFSGNAKWSQINRKPVHSTGVQARYHIKRYMASVGFEHLKIASPSYNFLTVGGGIYF